MGLTRAQHAFTVAIATGRGLAVDVWGAQCHLWPHGGPRSSHSEPRSAQAVARHLLGMHPFCVSTGLNGAPHEVYATHGRRRTRL